MPSATTSPANPTTDTEELKLKVPLLQRALSLRPDETVLDGYVEGNAYCRLIIESWRPRFAVRVVSKKEFDAMSRACSGVLFNA